MNFGNNTNLMNHPNYPKSFVQASVPQQMKYVHNSYRLVLNSADRNRCLYRNPNEYKVNLPRRYRNVSSIEVCLIALPNFSNSEKYFLIQLEELCDGPYDSLDPEISKSLALVPNRHAFGNYNYILEAPGDTSFVKNYIKKFIDVPLASLNSLTVKIKKANHDIVNFGKDLLPYDKENSFSLNSSHHTDNYIYKIDNINHDLAYYDPYNKDVIKFYDCKITYLDTVKNCNVTVDLPQFNKEYVASCLNDDELDDMSSSLNQYTLDNNNEYFYIKNIESENFDSYTNWKITGKWKRVCNSNNYYSRIRIICISVENGVIIATVGNIYGEPVNHNLETYDRIYIDYSGNLPNGPKTHWYKNFHVVTGLGDINGKNSNTKFRLSVDNITLEDFANNELRDDVTQNPMLPNEERNDGEITDTTMEVDAINEVYRQIPPDINAACIHPNDPQQFLVIKDDYVYFCDLDQKKSISYELVSIVFPEVQGTVINMYRCNQNGTNTDGLKIYDSIYINTDFDDEAGSGPGYKFKYNWSIDNPWIFVADDSDVNPLNDEMWNATNAEFVLPFKISSDNKFQVYIQEDGDEDGNFETYGENTIYFEDLPTIKPVNASMYNEIDNCYLVFIDNKIYTLKIETTVIQNSDPYDPPISNTDYNVINNIEYYSYTIVFNGLPHNIDGACMHPIYNEFFIAIKDNYVYVYNIINQFQLQKVLLSSIFPQVQGTILNVKKYLNDINHGDGIFIVSDYDSDTEYKYTEYKYKFEDNSWVYIEETQINNDLITGDTSSQELQFRIDPNGSYQVLIDDNFDDYGEGTGLYESLPTNHPVNASLFNTQNNVYLVFINDTIYELNVENNTVIESKIYNPVITNVVLPEPKILPSENYGYFQKYGDPDPSIQNLLIFNVNTRDEDDQQVRSENISHGNMHF
jgi:hypothetical protein